MYFNGKKQMAYREKKELAAKALKRLAKAQPPRPLNLVDAGYFPAPPQNPFNWKGFVLGLAVLLAVGLFFTAVLIGFNEDFVWK